MLFLFSLVKENGMEFDQNFKNTTTNKCIIWPTFYKNCEKEERNIRILSRGEYFGEQVAKFTVGYCSGKSTFENR